MSGTREAKAGIYFLAEWVPNRFSAWLGPRTFGLPYRHGKLHYEHEPVRGWLRGRVTGSRSAGFQPAKVSPICNRQGVRKFGAALAYARTHSQVENLRHGRWEICAAGLCLHGHDGHRRKI